MNENTLISFFQKLINNPESFGSIEEMIKQTKNMFEDLLKTLQELSPEEQKRMQKTLVELSSYVNKEFDRVCAETGISRSEFEEMLANPAMFKEGEWSALQDLKKKAETVNKKPVKKAKIKRHKKSKQWVSA